MHSFIVLITLLTVTQALFLSELDEQQWQKFKIDYGKTYKNEEEENMRKEIFVQKLKMFEEHNKKYKDGLVSHRVGITKFADITHEEYQQMFPPINVSAVPHGFPFIPPANVKVPKSIDWRKKGVVLPVRDLDICKPSSALSALGVLEGQLYLKTKKFIPLSIQNLVDCTKAGCKGEVPPTYFEYVVNNDGIDTEGSYPQEGEQGKCRYDAKYSAGKFKKFYVLPTNDENALLTAVGTIGPISICMSAEKFLTYKGGILETSCKNNHTYHCALVVGYGTSSKGKDYWIIENTWGSSFGEHGYVRVIRNKNLCGIAGLASYATL